MIPPSNVLYTQQKALLVGVMPLTCAYKCIYDNTVLHTTQSISLTDLYCPTIPMQCIALSIIALCYSALIICYYSIIFDGIDTMPLTLLSSFTRRNNGMSTYVAWASPTARFDAVCIKNAVLQRSYIALTSGVPTPLVVLVFILLIARVCMAPRPFRHSVLFKLGIHIRQHYSLSVGVV